MGCSAPAFTFDTAVNDDAEDKANFSEFNLGLLKTISAGIKASSPNVKNVEEKLVDE